MKFEAKTLKEISGGGSYGLGASAEQTPVGPKFLRTTDIVSGTIDWDAVPYCEADAVTINKYRLHANDIVISRTGANAGINCIVTQPPVNAIFAGYLVRFQIDERVADSHFVSYVLRSAQWADYVANTRTGSAQPQLNAVLMGNFSFPLPPLGMQTAISRILKVLDEKIEVNKRISRTLEETAQTIFKSWFIDFDPVKAKMAGEKPVGMDEATAALFPDSIEDSELGPIPTGWTKTSFGNFVQARRGKVITKAKTSDGLIPVIAGGLEPAYFHNQANVSWPAVTVSASGANAGFVRLNLMDIWASDCSYISRIETEYVYFSYIFLKYQQENIFNMQQGGAQPHIYPADIARLTFSSPANVDVFERFEKWASSIFEHVRNLEEQIRTLSELRDSLLPRLISGELKIPKEMLVS